MSGMMAVRGYEASWTLQHTIGQDARSAVLSAHQTQLPGRSEGAMLPGRSAFYLVRNVQLAVKYESRKRCNNVGS